MKVRVLASSMMLNISAHAFRRVPSSSSAFSRRSRSSTSLSQAAASPYGSEIEIARDIAAHASAVARSLQVTLCVNISKWLQPCCPSWIILKTTDLRLELVSVCIHHMLFSGSVTCGPERRPHLYRRGGNGPSWGEPRHCCRLYSKFTHRLSPSLSPNSLSPIPPPRLNCPVVHVSCVSQ